MKNKIKGLSIRSAVVLNRGKGFIIAGDPKKEKNEIPHAILFRWRAGILNKGEAKFSAYASCILETPEYGILRISGCGIYSFETASGSNVSNIFRDSQPKPNTPRYGEIRTLSECDGKAYAAGLGGMVYRLDQPDLWTRIDEGLPADFDIECIDGFSASDIYIAGYGGELWHFDGRKWQQIDLPTDVILGSLTCSEDGVVYIGGNAGTLIYGRNQTWNLIQGQISETISGLAHFKGCLYVSTRKDVYQLVGGVLERVDLGNGEPTTGQLSSCDDTIWSIGRKDIRAYDGVCWSTIV